MRGNDKELFLVNSVFFLGMLGNALFLVLHWSPFIPKELYNL